MEDEKEKEMSTNKCHLSPEITGLKPLFLDFANFILVEPERIELIASECKTDDEVRERIMKAVNEDFEYWARKQDWKRIPNISVELEEWYKTTSYYKYSDSEQSEKGWKLILEFLKHVGSL